MSSERYLQTSDQAGVSPGVLARILSQPWIASLFLLLLCAVTYVPGVYLMPPVDRTEVIFAETTRDMVARENYLDPRYGETVHQFRPIGTYWAQAVAAKAAGPSLARDIRVYRLPGLIAVMVSVLALFWMVRPLTGAEPALLAAALFAVSPLTVLLSQLAIADGLALLPGTLAALALLRLYCSLPEEDTNRLSFVFWVAIGFSVLINALQTPVLIGVILGGLYVLDRDLFWLHRLRLNPGLIIAVLLSAPWLIVRVMQDGVPFSGMSASAFAEALGGSQDMKLSAYPLSFTLALVLGFSPGTALLWPAVRRLWQQNTSKICKFLLVWIAGYLAYLELISSKPGTYAVQLLFPAAALAVALLISDIRGIKRAPPGNLIPHPLLAVLFALGLFAIPYAVFKEMPAMWLFLPASGVALLFLWSAVQGRSGKLSAWATTSIAAFAAFAPVMMGGVLPQIEKIWPARQIQETIAKSCNPNLEVGVVGYREPSARFVLGADTSDETIETVLNRKPPITIIEDRWIDKYSQALKARGGKITLPYTCVWSYNATRGCNLSFLIAGQNEAAHCFKNLETVCETPNRLRDVSDNCN